MTQNYDIKLLIDELRKYLPNGSTVLQLGMGGRADLLLLRKYYKATGSDNSIEFRNRFRGKLAALNMIYWDATIIDTDRRYDGVYSNKVLNNLTREQVINFLKLQAEVLNPNGIALHSFWHGESEDVTFYTQDTIREVIGAEYEVVKVERYTEDEKDDSLFVVLKKRDATS